MTRTTRARALLALAVVALSVYIALTVPARLGLDLRGGTQIVLETQDASRNTSATASAPDAEAADRTLEVLRRRVDALGVTEPTIARSGEDRILVELPGVQDPQEAADVLGQTAQLTVHRVTGQGGGGGGEQQPKLGEAALTGADVSGAEAAFDPQNGLGWFVTMDLRGKGEATWARLTGEAACAPAGDPARRIAIVLDDKTISSPAVEPSVGCGTGITGGSTQITGDFTREEARELALLINGGALPVPVEIVEQRTVGPTLGAEAITSSAQAALIGVTLTSLFMLAVYRLLGGLAALALACYGLLSYAALAGLGATLTLPGLAGYVLAVGMAVDANVLVFERAREEYAARRRGVRSLRSALRAGFRNAFSAVADSNITTLIAAGLLFFLSSGPVRGFAVTLTIGVLASMFSALVVTRALAEFAVTRGALRRRPRLSGIAGTGRVRDLLTRRAPDLLTGRARRRRWLAASALAVVMAGSGIAVRGLDLGVEFTGGRMTEYSTASPVDADRARDALSDLGHPRAVVQNSGDGDLTVRTAGLSNAESARIGETIADLGDGAEKVRDELIGPSLGDELRRGALIALTTALAAQLLYLAVRFRWTFGTSAVVAMAHDVLILLGVFAWLGKPVDGVFVAALLTVIGYSVNDSVVVFDRIRELTSRRPRSRKRTFAAAANTAVLQTLPRTVNTGAGAVFILTALAVLGGDSLHDFALALLIGIVVGTWSSVFTAAPLTVELEARRTTGRPSDARQPATTTG